MGLPMTEMHARLKPVLLSLRVAPIRMVDGIADKDDQCPERSRFVKQSRLPRSDTDKDGIADDKDKCPTVAALPATMDVLCLIRTKMVVNDER
jgi:hypothetical protein